MPRCNQCNKFATLEPLEPEAETPEVEGGSAFVNIRIVNSCAECGQDLRESTFELDAELGPGWDQHDPADDPDQTHELTAEIDSLERTERTEGSGRYAKKFYGVRCDLTIQCKCGQYTDKLQLSDEIQASSMEDCQ